MLIKAGRLIDGTGGAAKENWCLLIDRGTIVATMPEECIPAEHQHELLDLSRLTVLPGLIDTHVHVFLAGIEDHHERARRWKEPEDFTFIYAMDNMRMTIEKGVTTVRDLGGPYCISLRLKAAIENGVLPGPRILTCNRAISAIGGHFYYAGGRQVEGAPDVMKAVQEQVKGGADCIKAMVTGAVNFQQGDAGRVELTNRELHVVVEEAQKNQLPVAVHANGNNGVRLALQAGVSTIEHGALLDETTVDQMISSSVYWTPTLLPFFCMLEYSRYQLCTSLPYEGIRPVYEQHQANVRRAIAGGVKILAGTDAGALGAGHGDIWREIALLTDLGMTPEKAIHAATGLAACALGIEAEAGTLEAGKQADLLAVAGNPAEDIRCLRNVRFVFQKGKCVFSYQMV